MCLSEYLKLDEVIDFGIYECNVGYHVTPSPVILVYNATSANSKIHLCAALAMPDKVSGYSVNEFTGDGLTNVPHIAKVLLKNRSALDFSTRDITSFYTNVFMDVLGSLVSSIYLQDIGQGTDPFLRSKL